ncbi:MULTISPECIES: hypothetical protein [Cyanophyceae]|uniref:hypothetical protein n=1 Tax=Cyanophyceae TaxID=3028117 RepID=UPI0007458BD3|nr:MULTISPECIES: hypothetical protein [Cyanophyceae]AMA09901.1 hypothetical protein AWQ23_11565 [Picosynechococcus sp. PCC 73109]
MVALFSAQHRTKFWGPVLLLTLMLLSSCGGGENSPEEAVVPESQPLPTEEIPVENAPQVPNAKNNNSPPKDNLVVQGEPIQNAPADSAAPKITNKTTLEAGAYCYRTEEQTIQAIAELLVEPTNDVSGTLEATITNDAAGYYTSYNQRIAGVLDTETLSAAVVTNIENDVQNSQETWTLNRNVFSNGRDMNLKRVSCEEIIALKANRKNSP